MSIQKRAGALVIAVMVALGGCAQTVRLNTEPEGAELYVNNIYIGNTPVQYRARTGTPETAYVRLVKPGYQEVKNATIDKVYRADVSLFWLLPGIFPYFIATAKFEDDYIFHLLKK